jgi:CotH kinase protein/Lamin Tail Domain/Chitobiase/beta-hexosaminidase C-terminal domain/Secretion system C-terminal sorting domain/Divergent InlB B-repeat domain
MKKTVFFVLLLGFFIYAYSQSIVINEFMSSNIATIADEDGDFPDWIELYNPENTTISLENYGITDDVNEPFKWIFPAVSLTSHNHLLVFASGKDRNELLNHWETIINWGNIWRYTVFDYEPPANWNELTYDDTDWLAGSSGFGYGDGDDTTFIDQTISAYIRKIFNITDLDNIMGAVLHVDYDDAFVAYLNGVEIARANIGEPGIPPAFDQTAADNHEAEIYQGGFPEIHEVNSDFLQAGDNVLAIQVHNISATSSDLTMIPFFTLMMNTPPINANGAPEILQLPTSQLHTNFKIQSNGETLMLSTPDGIVCDSLDTGYLPGDISRGRQPDGGEEWNYFEESTPGQSNSANGYQTAAQDPEYSFPGGFYESVISLAITGAAAGETIYYTMDGAEPDASSEIYNEPLAINQHTVIRSIILGEGILPSRIVTHSYFINLDTELPVISISSTPANFWDPNTGIYVLGYNASPDFPFYGANFWEDWERPINIEMFEQDGSLAFNIPAGVKIFGGWSRGLSQKSLSIFARGIYGASEINYQIFEDKQIDSFEAIVLRNSGNDWERTMFRDGLMSELVKDTNIDRQAYRAAAIFINGEYWGIQNIREKINEHFIAANHEGVDPDNIDLLSLNMEVLEGDNVRYMALINYIETHDMSEAASYEHIGTQMDLDNYLDYQVAEIYFDNTDWPGNNIKYWRPRTIDGKWRWIIYDTDFGFGIWNQWAYTYNTLAFALDPNGPFWPNPPWSTFLFRKLMENYQFEIDFVNRFADCLNSIFLADRAIGTINDIEAQILQDIPAHIARWNGNYGSIESVAQWNYYVQVLRDFAANRAVNVQSHIRQEFNLPGMAQLTLDIEPAEGGKIKINSIMPQQYPWTGSYFQQNPITLTAVPEPGFQFSGWEGITSQEITVTQTLTEDLSLMAIFEGAPFDSTLSLINEINYQSSDNFDPDDWVEVYNPHPDALDISFWQFKDENDEHIFEIPANTILNADEYLVLCKDTALFSSAFPHVTNYIGDFDFGLSGGGELIRLFDADGVLIDSVNYDDENGWNPLPDGNGNTLELIDPAYDNSLPESWQASLEYGTPGEHNSDGVSFDEDKLPQSELKLRNYPNPFNPATTISFTLEATQQVKINIYNIRGELVSELANETMPAGRHQIEFTGNEFASGIYFYQVEVPGISETRKMILLK